MSNIHNYPLERFNFGDDDYYDIDYWNGSTYETAKIKGSVIKAAIVAAIPPGVNIYNADGTMTGDRILTGDNFRLFFQTMGEFIVHSHKANVDNVVFEVRSDPTYHGFIVKDHNTGVHMLACRNGLVEISDAYFLPGVDGSPGQVMVTDGSGNVSWQSIVDVNIYNSDGTLTGNRLISMGGFGLAVQDVSILLRLNPGINPEVVIGGLTTPSNYAILDVNGLSSHFGVITSNQNGFWLQLVESVNRLNLIGTLTANRNQTFQDADGIIALLSDIVNLYNANGSLTGTRFVDLNGNVLYFTDIAGQVEIRPNEIRVQANAGGEAIYKAIAGNGQKRGWSLQDQGDDRWELVGDGVETGGNAGTDLNLYHYDDAGVLIGIALNVNRATGQLTFNSAYSFPVADGTAGQVLTTNGSGVLSFQTPSGSLEKKIDTFYAYDMSAAAAGGGTYTWNATAVGSTTITTLSERYRLQIFAGVGQADGCFVNSILPSFYVPGGNIRIDITHTVNGAGGDYKFFVGIVKPNGANFGDGTTTIWQSVVVTASAGFPMNSSSFTFNGSGLNISDAIGILIYRDPGDVQDTYTGDVYLNTINVEQV